MKRGKILLIIATLLIPLIAYIESILFYTTVERDFSYYLSICVVEAIVVWAGYYIGKGDYYE